MSDVERNDEQPEVEGHLQDDEERRPHLDPERAASRRGTPPGPPPPRTEGPRSRATVYGRPRAPTPS